MAAAAEYEGGEWLFIVSFALLAGIALMAVFVYGGFSLNAAAQGEWQWFCVPLLLFLWRLQISAAAWNKA